MVRFRTIKAPTHLAVIVRTYYRYDVGPQYPGVPLGLGKRGLPDREVCCSSATFDRMHAWGTQVLVACSEPSLRELTSSPTSSSHPTTISESGAADRDRTVLLVGGAGYVGSVAVARLLDDGYRVIVLDPLLYGGESLAKVRNRPGFELHVADTRDTSVLWSLLVRSMGVIHLGEIVGDPACELDPSVTVSINHQATVALAELARQAGVARFIYPSSCSVYGATEEIADERGGLNPVSLYGRLKQACEESILALASEAFHPTVFRLATVYGLSPRPRFDLVVNTLAGRAAAEGEIVVQGGGQWRPFVHVSDVARVLVGVLRAPTYAVSGEIFNLGSNQQNHTISDVAAIVREELPSVSLQVTEGVDRRNYRVDFEKIRDVLGFEPSRTVRDGVSEIVTAVLRGEIVDVRAARHSNVRALIETEARGRVWRSDMQDGHPAAPFLPRDVDRQIETPAGRSHARREEEVLT